MSKLLGNRLLYAVLAIILPFAIVNQYYFNFLGLALVGIIWTLFVILSKPLLTITDYIFAGVSILSSIAIGLYTSWLVILFSLFTFVYSLSWLTIKPQDNKFLKILHLFAPWLIAFFVVWSSKDTLSSLKSNFNNKHSESTKSNSTFEKNLLNVIITFLVIIVILPLLSYSNPYFGSFVEEFFKNVTNFFKDFLSIFTIVKILIGVYIYNVLPRIFCFLQSYKEPKYTAEKEFDLSMPKTAVAITLGFFLFSQLKTYLNPELLMTTSGKIANEVFFHLSVVCLIVFVLIFVNLKYKFVTKCTNVVLIIQTLFLVGIAYNSDWSYVTNWGLTHKRLYGFAVVAMIFGFALVFLAYLKNKSYNPEKYIAIVFCVILCFTNLANFDYQIYRNPPRESLGIELDYISAMSLDSMSLDKEYANSITKFNNISQNYSYSCLEKNWADRNIGNYNYLTEKYKSSQILSFNWSEYQNYLLIKNLSKIDQNEMKFDKGVVDCYRRNVNFTNSSI
jgi:Domain of unknown function (DUF4173)